MKCECGHSNEQGVKFCGKCGAQVPEESFEAAEESAPDIKETVASVVESVKVLPVKTLLKFSIPAVLIIAALIIVLPMLGGSNISVAKNSLVIWSDGDTVIVSGNNNRKFTIDGELHSLQYSLDGSKAAVLVDWDYRNNNGGTLWFVTVKNSSQIAEDVLSFRLADSGNGVAYFTDADSRNNTAALYLYNTSSGRGTMLTDDAMYPNQRGLQGISVSPDGKTAAYVRDLDSSTGEYAGFISVNGSSERLGSNMHAVALSNRGKHIYYMRTNIDENSRVVGSSLHVRSGRNDNRLIAEISSITAANLILNKDYSQALFVFDGRTSITRNGGERTRVSNAEVMDLVLPRNAEGRSHGNGITVYGVRSFANTLAFVNSENRTRIELINRRFEATAVSGTNGISLWENYIFVSNDGKTLLFINESERLVRVDPTKENAERENLASNVASFTASSDGKTIFYVSDLRNNKGELWRIRGNGSPSKISDDVASRLALSSNDKKVFFLIDFSNNNGGELRVSNNGRRGVKIADDVMSVWSSPQNVFYRTSDHTLFRSSGNDRFNHFHDFDNPR
jgi:hypothetical protein